MKTAEEMAAARERLKDNMPALAAWVNAEREAVKQENQAAQDKVKAARDEVLQGPEDTPTATLAEQTFARVWPDVLKDLDASTADWGVGVGRDAIVNAQETVRPLIAQNVVAYLERKRIGDETITLSVLAPASPRLHDAIEARHKNALQTIIAMNNLDHIEAGTPGGLVSDSKYRA